MCKCLQLQHAKLPVNTSLYQRIVAGTCGYNMPNRFKCGIDFSKYISVSFVREPAVDEGGPLWEFLMGSIAMNNSLFGGRQECRVPAAVCWRDDSGPRWSSPCRFCSMCGSLHCLCDITVYMVELLYVATHLQSINHFQHTCTYSCLALQDLRLAPCTPLPPNKQGWRDDCCVSDARWSSPCFFALNTLFMGWISSRQQVVKSPAWKCLILWRWSSSCVQKEFNHVHIDVYCNQHTASLLCGLYFNELWVKFFNSKDLLNCDEYDFRFDVGLGVLTDSMNFGDHNEIVQSLAGYFTVVKVKAQIDKLVEGVGVPGILI